MIPHSFVEKEFAKAKNKGGESMKFTAKKF
jgi:hypothetical protein